METIQEVLFMTVPIHQEGKILKLLIGNGLRIVSFALLGPDGVSLADYVRAGLRTPAPPIGQYTSPKYSAMIIVVEGTKESLRMFDDFVSVWPSEDTKIELGLL